MKFAGFKRAVKKVAEGRYHCVFYQLTEYHTGELNHKWKAYIDGKSWTDDHASPEEALKEIILMPYEEEV